jgi:hypothetical protein
MDDKPSRRHTMEVSTYAWNTGKRIWGLKDPASRLREILDEGMRRLDNSPIQQTINRQDHEPPQESTRDFGVLIEAKYEAICASDGDLIEPGEKMLRYTGKDGNKYYQCMTCLRARLPLK